MSRPNAIASRRSIVIVTLIAALVLSACGGDTTTFSLTPPAEAQELLAAPPPGLALLDVRTPEEFDAGHLAGATNVDFYAAEFTAQLDALDKEQPYFVYCRSGNRSAQTIEIMRDLGFSEVYELEGGILSWLGAGLPVE